MAGSLVSPALIYERAIESKPSREVWQRRQGETKWRARHRLRQEAGDLNAAIAEAMWLTRPYWQPRELQVDIQLGALPPVRASFAGMRREAMRALMGLFRSLPPGATVRVITLRRGSQAVCMALSAAGGSAQRPRAVVLASVPLA